MPSLFRGAGRNAADTVRRGKINKRFYRTEELSISELFYESEPACVGHALFHFVLWRPLQNK